MACRDSDTAARYGGEEFVVILPDCGPERIRPGRRAATRGGRRGRRGQGAHRQRGVASFPANATDLEALIRAADNALLVSNRTGRNRTTAATTGANGTPTA